MHVHHVEQHCARRARFVDEFVDSNPPVAHALPASHLDAHIALDAMSSMSLAEYDALIYPGFLRRNVARWNDDGSAAPLSRARGPKNETFVLHLRSGEIDQDVSAIEQEVRVQTCEVHRARV